MSELLPCPFCGGNPDIHARHWTNGNHDWWISCIKCCSETTTFNDAEEAIKAWNTRAERTCQPIKRDGIRYCSKCGYTLGIISLPRYCAICGAKVVK